MPGSAHRFNTSSFARTIAGVVLGGIVVLGSSCDQIPGPTKQVGDKSSASASAPQARPSNDQARAFLKQHCQECHGGDKPEGKFFLDRLSQDFDDKKMTDQWLRVQARITSGSMPPKKQERPPADDVLAVSDWITKKVAAADVARRAAQGRVVLRRLNRVEYENTIRDLLDVQVDLKDLLPVDSSADGFDNIGSALHMSSFLMERYLEAADTSLGLAIANGPQPPLIKKRYSLKDQHQVKTTTEKVFRVLDDDSVVLFSSSPWQAVHLHEFYPPDRGKYRFRISASGFQSSGKPVTYRVDAGLMGMVGKSHLVGYFDAPADKAAVVEFVEYLEARSSIRILPYGLEGAQAVDKIGADKYEGAGLAVQWVEVEGPLYDAWPPESHRQLFGELGQETTKDKRLEVTSKNPEADAERILRDFARRGFRRAVTDDDIKPFLALVKAKLEEKRTFEQSVRVGLLGVMLSPDFLFLREKPGKLDDYALASRLSYFLWSTMPDEELLKLAGDKKLGQPEVLRKLVERMLKDPKSSAFTENFVGQWLGLRDIDFTEPSHILYPEFDDMLKASMLKETYLFFDEVLKNDLSITNFVASDFTLLNGRLAKHYGISDVDGWDFRKVTLPENSHRGGVLTMGSVLKITANGTNTSPVTRGVFVLDRILGQPPPRPPDGVPALEPDIRGATTMREQLAKHRQITSCATCHARIDPAGFALESFDVVGGWRENYRTSGNGDPVTVDGRRMPYLKGLKVDPSDVMADGQSFRDIDEFKQLLLKDKNQLARALTIKLVTYATGGPPERLDAPEIEALVARARDNKYGLRSLVHEIVQSKLFREK